MNEAEFFGCAQLISLWSTEQADIQLITWQDWLMQQREIQDCGGHAHPLFGVQDAGYLFCKPFLEEKYGTTWIQPSIQTGYIHPWMTLDCSRSLDQARHAFYGLLSPPMEKDHCDDKKESTPSLEVKDQFVSEHEFHRKFQETTGKLFDDMRFTPHLYVTGSILHECMYVSLPQDVSHTIDVVILHTKSKYDVRDVVSRFRDIIKTRPFFEQITPNRHVFHFAKPRWSINLWTCFSAKSTEEYIYTQPVDVDACLFQPSTRNWWMSHRCYQALTFCVNCIHVPKDRSLYSAVQLRNRWIGYQRQNFDLYIPGFAVQRIHAAYVKCRVRLPVLEEHEEGDHHLQLLDFLQTPSMNHDGFNEYSEIMTDDVLHAWEIQQRQLIASQRSCQLHFYSTAYDLAL